MPRYPSRFLLDIDPTTLEFSNPPTEVQMQQARSAYGFTDKWISEMSSVPEFAPGDRVLHSVFGEGVIQEIDSEKRAYVIQFDALPTPRALSFRVKLEHL